METLQKAVGSFWTTEEIDLTKDHDDWEKLSPDEKYFLENVLAFFAGSDGIVAENLGEMFYREVQIPKQNVFMVFKLPWRIFMLKHILY